MFYIPEDPIPTNPVLARVLFKRVLPMFVKRVNEPWEATFGPAGVFPWEACVAFTAKPEKLYIFHDDHGITAQIGPGNQTRDRLYYLVNDHVFNERIYRLVQRYKQQ